MGASQSNNITYQNVNYSDADIRNKINSVILTGGHSEIRNNTSAVETLDWGRATEFSPEMLKLPTPDNYVGDQNAHGVVSLADLLNQAKLGHDGQLGGKRRTGKVVNAAPSNKRYKKYELKNLIKKVQKGGDPELSDADLSELRRIRNYLTNSIDNGNQLGGGGDYPDEDNDYNDYGLPSALDSASLATNHTPEPHNLLSLFGGSRKSINTFISEYSATSSDFAEGEDDSEKREAHDSPLTDSDEELDEEIRNSNEADAISDIDDHQDSMDEDLEDLDVTSQIDIVDSDDTNDSNDSNDSEKVSDEGLSYATLNSYHSTSSNNSEINIAPFSSSEGSSSHYVPRSRNRGN